jgi:hypothetical protein
MKESAGNAEKAERKRPESTGVGGLGFHLFVLYASIGLVCVLAIFVFVRRDSSPSTPLFSSDQFHFEDGILSWQSSEGAPNTTYHLRGNVSGYFINSNAISATVITEDGTALTYIIPWDRVVICGDRDLY